MISHLRACANNSEPSHVHALSILSETIEGRLFLKTTKADRAGEWTRQNCRKQPEFVQGKSDEHGKPDEFDSDEEDPAFSDGGSEDTQLLDI